MQVYAGPHSLGLSPNDQPVNYDNVKDEFTFAEGMTSGDQAESSRSRRSLSRPRKSRLSSRETALGFTFRHGRTEQPDSVTDLVARSTSPDRRLSHLTRSVRQGNPRSSPSLEPVPRRSRVTTRNRRTSPSRPSGQKPETVLANGQLFVIKGGEVPFFIPPTGFEVLRRTATTFVKL